VAGVKGRGRWAMVGGRATTRYFRFRSSIQHSHRGALSDEVSEAPGSAPLPHATPPVPPIPPLLAWPIPRHNHFLPFLLSSLALATFSPFFAPCFVGPSDKMFYVLECLITINNAIRTKRTPTRGRSAGV